MGLWIPVTLAAALLQCVRTALQQRLKALLSTNGAGFVRYVYGAPVSALMLLAAALVGEVPFDRIGPAFFFYATLGGLAQIVATSLLIYAFTLRNFAVGTTYSKTETVQAALFSTVLLGEPLGLGAWFAILVSFCGVMVLSLRGAKVGPLGLIKGLSEKAALVGIASGGVFAIAAVSIRAGALSLGDSGAFGRAILVLAVMNTLQTLMLGSYLAVRERQQLVLVIVHWRSSLVVGLLSVFGSACWAFAMTLQHAAEVRALGQIELIFTFIASRYFLGERPRPMEMVGSLLVVSGVVFLLVLR